MTTDGIYELPKDEDYWVRMWLYEAQRVPKSKDVTLVGQPRLGRFNGSLPVKLTVNQGQLPKGSNWPEKHASGHLAGLDIIINVEFKDGKFIITENA